MGNCCKIIYEKDSEQIFEQNLENEISYSQNKINNKLESSHDFTLRETTDFTNKTPSSKLKTGKKTPFGNNNYDSNNSGGFGNDDFYNFMKKNGFIEVNQDEYDEKIPIKIKEVKNNDSKENDTKIFKNLNNNCFYKGNWVKNTNNKVNNNEYLFNGKNEILIPNVGNNNTMIIDGEFKDGNFENGRIYFENGSYYEGPIDNYKANGKGKFVNDNIIYESNFKNNIKEGDGFIKINNYSNDYNIIYEGEFKNDYINDNKAKINIYNNNTNTKINYLGSIKDNIIDPLNGKIYFFNEMIYDFNESLLIFPYNDGKLKCKFYNGKLHGKLIYIDNENNEYECEYRYGHYVKESIEKTKDFDEMLYNVGEIILLSDFDQFMQLFYKNEKGEIYDYKGNKVQNLNELIGKIHFEIL